MRPEAKKTMLVRSCGNSVSYFLWRLPCRQNFFVHKADDEIRTSERSLVTTGQKERNLHDMSSFLWQPRIVSNSWAVRLPTKALLITTNILTADAVADVTRSVLYTRLCRRVLMVILKRHLAKMPKIPTKHQLKGSFRCGIAISAAHKIRCARRLHYKLTPQVADSSSWQSSQIKFNSEHKTLHPLAHHELSSTISAISYCNCYSSFSAQFHLSKVNTHFRAPEHVESQPQSVIAWPRNFKINS